VLPMIATQPDNIHLPKWAFTIPDKCVHSTVDTSFQSFLMALEIIITKTCVTLFRHPGELCISNV